MRFNLNTAIKSAKAATEDYIEEKREKRRTRNGAAPDGPSSAQIAAEAEAAALAADLCAEHDTRLTQIVMKLTGTSATEMPPLVASPPDPAILLKHIHPIASDGTVLMIPPPPLPPHDNKHQNQYHYQHQQQFPTFPPPPPLPPRHKAVFLVTTPIEFLDGHFELSRSTYKLLARHVGMSLQSLSHWLLCVVDRSTPLPSIDGPGPIWCYDLMSDQLALNALGKSYLRVYEGTPEVVDRWSSAYYVGETTRSHEAIAQMGQVEVSQHPRYNLVSNNCQDLVEALVKQLCDGKVISQAKLSEELALVSPKIALDLMVARLRTRIDARNEHEDSNEVKEDMDAIKGLWGRVQHH